MIVQVFVDKIAARIAKSTEGFVKTKIGQAFLSLPLLGPISFLPQVWTAWTAPNIEALSTSTFPMMIIVNSAIFLSLCHKGDWRVRITVVLWMILFALTWLATLIR